MAYLSENHLYCLMKSKNIPIWRSVSGTVIEYGHKSREFHPSHAEKGAV